eukprot:CAMPEP_0181539488 /NCGR_PEP_ID=MMETSP1110-20121109/76399_1 /TAXON_ID=174948 /ORGANISM="Symbiodinium sp., Strain CCMP421" /LENGTH=61 /DNA_ID=CAMNT_0023671105 /DNA_START=290 /DNA_END=472 /DNA_ORIENTATION=+
MDGLPFLCAVCAQATANGENRRGLTSNGPPRVGLHELGDVKDTTTDCNPPIMILVVFGHFF